MRAEELKKIRRELLTMQGRLKTLTRTVERLIGEEVRGTSGAAPSESDGSAARVIERLNELTGARYSAAGPGAQYVRAALEAGHSEEELIRVAESMTEAWKDDRRMRPYLRPETLFGEHLESYIACTNERVDPFFVLSGIERAAALKLQRKGE